MASRYHTKVPVHFSAGGKVTIDDQQGVHKETRAKDMQKTEESMYTNLQFAAREKQPPTSSSERVVNRKTGAKTIAALAVLITACVILVLFALVMAGVTLNSSQETSKESTRSSALIDSLEDQVTQLRQELNSMHTALAIAQHDLNTSLHSPLHPYQNCHTDTVEGRMLPITSTTYYTRRVNTPYRTINMTGYYTLDIHCHYETTYDYGYTVVTQLYQSGSDMLCYCTVYYPQTTSDSLIDLTRSTSFYLDCILSITRCPLAQTIV